MVSRLIRSRPTGIRSHAARNLLTFSWTFGSALTLAAIVAGHRRMFFTLGSVDSVSTDPSVKNMRRWPATMAARVNADPNVHENVSRFLAACDRMPVGLDRMRRDTMIQLAWMGRKNG